MDKEGAVRLDDSRAGIIEIHCVGSLNGGHLSYLTDLAACVEKAPRVCLLYNTLQMTRFAPAFPMGHVDAFKRWLSRIPKIAVAPASTAVGLAISSVRMATGANMKGFNSRNDAISWLEAS
jgi:hypothetical protein